MKTNKIDKTVLIDKITMLLFYISDDITVEIADNYALIIYNMLMDELQKS
jgi:hypothetical protein